MPESRGLPACERFRVLAALQLDGEASALELEAQAVHATQCPACRDYAVDLEAITAQLRAALAQLPSRPIPIRPAKTI